MSAPVQEPDNEPAEDEEETNVAALNQLAAMAPAELLALFAQFAMHRNSQASSSAASNEALVEELQRHGEIASPAVVQAFLSVDRKVYCVDADDEEAYADRPYRSLPRDVDEVPKAIHLSAPGIYGRCVEQLDLKPGLSFLNIGSGTGYLSAVVASLIGPHAIHHAIELRTSLVELSRTLAAERGLSSIVFHNRSFHAVDPKHLDTSVSV